MKLAFVSTSESKVDNKMKLSHVESAPDPSMLPIVLQAIPQPPANLPDSSVQISSPVMEGGWIALGQVGRRGKECYYRQMRLRPLVKQAV